MFGPSRGAYSQADVTPEELEAVLARFLPKPVSPVSGEYGEAIRVAIEEREPQPDQGKAQRADPHGSDGDGEGLAARPGAGTVELGWPS